VDHVKNDLIRIDKAARINNSEDKLLERLGKSYKACKEKKWCK